MKDEGGRMNENVFIHPSAFILDFSCPQRGGRAVIVKSVRD
jgi:hypothetical protein